MISGRFLGALAALVWIAAIAGGAPAGRPPASETVEDRRLMDDVQKRAVRFFIECAHPITGLVRDRASNKGADDYTVASIAATGYGLAALPVGVERGWLRRTDALVRAERCLRYVLTMKNQHGWLYHFVDWRTGEREWGCEVSTIDTALLVAGALACGSYFRGTAVEKLANRLYDRLDWTWVRTNGGTKPEKLLVSHGWKPETGFLPNDWDAYCEHMFLYLLGLGAGKNPLPEASWTAWKRGTYEYAGIQTIAAGPIFWHEMAHCYYDFRNKRDRLGYDYHAASVAAVRIHRRFCADNSGRRKGYGPNGWGLNACDGPDGYMAYGVPGPEDGTLSPTGALAAILFDSRAALDAAHYMRRQYGDRLWGRYGFANAYNVDRNWFDKDVIGIDLGMALLAVENHRSGLIWRLLQSHPSTRRAFTRAGFRATAGRAS